MLFTPCTFIGQQRICFRQNIQIDLRYTEIPFFIIREAQNDAVFRFVYAYDSKDDKGAQK